MHMIFVPYFPIDYTKNNVLKLDRSDVKTTRLVKKITIIYWSYILES